MHGKKGHYLSPKEKKKTAKTNFMLGTNQKGPISQSIVLPHDCLVETTKLKYKSSQVQSWITLFCCCLTPFVTWKECLVTRIVGSSCQCAQPMEEVVYSPWLPLSPQLPPRAPNPPPILDFFELFLSPPFHDVISPLIHRQRNFRIEKQTKYVVCLIKNIIQ